MRIVKAGHVQVGLITSNLWLVSSRFVHCVSVVSVAMYCQIEWCISQPQSALAFRLAQLRTLKIGIFMSHSGGSGSSPLYRRKIITYGKDYTKQIM